MDDLKATYNRIAKDWTKDHRDDTWWVEGTDKFVSYLNVGDTVLDVGCGAGTKSKYLAGKGLQVTGIDFSEEMIKLASQQVPTGKFFVMDIKDLSGLKNIFSGILAQAVLLHIPKKEVRHVLEQLKDKLNQGGYLYIAVKELKPGGKEEEIVVKNDYGYEYAMFFSYFTLDEIKEHLKNLQMEILYEDSVRAGKTKWLQVIARK